MSRSSGFASHRFLLALIALPVLGLSLAPAATASTLPSGCTELTAKIATADADPNHGEGDVIVLNGMCNAANLKMSAGVSIPAEANFSIEGAPGTTSGFDGTGVTAPLLHSTGFETAGTMTLRNLTFQHANVVAAAGSAIRVEITHLTLANDSFIENTLNGFGGGAVEVFLTAPGGKPVCQTSPGPAGVTVTNTVFRSNKVVATNQGAGGALVIAQICENPESILEGNVFEGNTVELSGSGEAFGGAFTFEPGAEKPTPLIQRGNVFDSNQIVSASTASNFGGGGEWTEGASLMSVGDRFSRNTLPGAGSPKWSWGGGLGIINSSCEPAASTESTLENAVVTGNTIGVGSGELGGAGIYAGCSPVPTHPNHLSLLDSTVTQNSVVGGGVGGIEGNPGDQLRLVNSIVSGDTSAETGGFNGTGGSLSASFSDVCAAGGASPLPGEGNICTNPLLANNGNPSSFDVHDTVSSPTIDAGSNALVPSGLTTDAFGTTRILAGHTGCIGSLPAVVDMGAAEFQSAAPSCLPPRPPARGLTHFVRLKTNAKGAALTLSCTSTDGLGCSGEIFLTTDETRQGKKVIAVGARKRIKRTKVSVRIGQAPFSLPAGGTATFQVKLNATGLQLLRRFHTISAWVLANETMTNSSPVIFLLHSTLFSQPKHKSKKHKSRHAKRRH
jgi:hypothetical protein